MHDKYFIPKEQEKFPQLQNMTKEQVKADTALNKEFVKYRKSQSIMKANTKKKAAQNEKTQLMAGIVEKRMKVTVSIKRRQLLRRYICDSETSENAKKYQIGIQ